MEDHNNYHIPLALTIISGIFLCIGGVLGLAVLADILVRRGWRSMMSIMIVVYPINALYNFPTVLLYWKYGRPTRPRKDDAVSGDKAAACIVAQRDSTNKSGTDVARHRCDSNDDQQAFARHEAESIPEQPEPHSNPVLDPLFHSESRGRDGFVNIHQQRQHQHQHNTTHCHDSPSPANPSALGPANESAVQSNADKTLTSASDGEVRVSDGCCHGSKTDRVDPELVKSTSDEPNCHSHAVKRPMWATVLIGVAHCGAGCVLGDLVGEWLVYGTGATINGAMLWPSLLVDYAFALLFGVAFQYFSIAPMSGEWGLKSVWRAAKADILSLTSFEVGAFAWMIIFQVGIFNYKLDMASWTYWWLMQMGMNAGYLTAVPMNILLLKRGIKEPCC